MAGYNRVNHICGGALGLSVLLWIFLLYFFNSHTVVTSFRSTSLTFNVLKNRARKINYCPVI